MPEEEKEEEEEKTERYVDVKIRLYDGSDIGTYKYTPTSILTVAALKETVVADWPKDKKIAPKEASELKLINAGKILENNKSIVSQCRTAFGELPEGAVTMHAVVQPSLLKSKTEKKADKVPKENVCSCSIL